MKLTVNVNADTLLGVKSQDAVNGDESAVDTEAQPEIVLPPTLKTYVPATFAVAVKEVVDAYVRVGIVNVDVGVA